MLAVAATLRLVGLDRFGLWRDEGVTAAFVTRPFTEMLTRFVDEPNCLAYQIVTWPLFALHRAEWTLRLPSVLFGVVTVAAVAMVGRRLGGSAVAIPAALMMATQPWAIALAQDARPYTLVMLLATVAFGLADGQPTAARLVVGVLVYANPLAALALAPVVQIRSRSLHLRGWLVAATVALPGAVLLAHDRLQRNPIFWLPPADLAYTREGFVRILGDQRILAVATALALAGLGIALLLRRRIDRPTVALAIWAIVLPLAMAIGSHATPIFTPRYIAFAVPGVCLLVAYGAYRLALHNGWIVPILLGLAYLGVAVAGTGEGAPRRWHEEWRDAARHLTAERRAGDPIVVFPADGLTVTGFYAPSMAASDGVPVATAWRDRGLPAGIVPLMSPGDFLRVPVGPPQPDLIRRLAAQTGTAFVLLGDDEWVDPTRSPGLVWAIAACDTQQTDFEQVTLLRIRECR